jgi:tetratricopeptide (TPR) repeat protein
MVNSEALQALTLGYSYLDDVNEQILSGNINDNYQLSSKLIKDLKSAIKNFEKAESLDPDVELEDGRNSSIGKAVSIGAIGCIKFEGYRERENAVKLLKEALDMHEELPMFHAELGAIYANQGNKQLAIDHLKRAIELEPDEMEYRKTLDKLEDLSDSALKTSAFKGNPIALIVWFGLAILSIIITFSEGQFIMFPFGLLCAFIGYRYWKSKSKS